MLWKANMKFYIYKIINKLNNKIYIGKHKVPKNGEDFYRYMGKGLAIRDAIKKYGKENFEKEILENIEDDEKQLLVDEREKFWIKELNSLSPNGYNLSPGGEGGCTSESAKKGAETRKRNGTNKTTFEQRLKMSIAAKGKPKSELHKKHLSEHHRTHKERTIIFEDGHVEISSDPIWKIAERYNMTAILLKRASEYDKFRNGIKIKELKNDKLVEQHNKIENGIFKDPFTNEEISYKKLRMKKAFDKKYKGINLFECFEKYIEN